MPNYNFCLLNINDFPQILLLLESEKHYYDDEIFLSPPHKYILKILSGYGKSVGCFINEKLIGVASIAFCKTDKNSLGHILNFKDNELQKTIQFEHILISRAFQGKGISKKLMNYLLSQIDIPFNHILCTIHPTNIKSLSLAFHFNFKITKVFKFFGYQRFLMKYEKDEPFKLHSETKILECNDYVVLDQLLNSGFQGVGFNQSKDRIFFTK